MDTNQNQTKPATQTGANSASSHPCSNGPVVEPEKMLTHPENQHVMPENKPENSSVARILSDDNKIYDPEDSGPFAWKPRSPLDRLPLRDQHYIQELLEQYTYEETRAFLQRPRPLGLGIRPSISALHGFYYRWRNDDLVDRLDMLDQQVAYIQSVAGNNDENFVQTSVHLLKRRLLESSISPVSKTAELRILFGILDRIKNTELAERRVALAEQKQSAAKP
jgi:hypothetical protein